jgi:uncharacterized membrane-anchored protein
VPRVLIVFNQHKKINEMHSDGDFTSYFGNDFGHSKSSDFVLKNCVLCTKICVRKRAVLRHAESEELFSNIKIFTKYIVEYDIGWTMEPPILCSLKLYCSMVVMCSG